MLLSFSVKDFDRKGNLTLGMGQARRREREDPGTLAALLLEMARLVVQSLFLFPSRQHRVYLRLPMNLQRRK